MSSSPRMRGLIATGSHWAKGLCHRAMIDGSRGMGPYVRRDDESMERSSPKNMQRRVLQQHDRLRIDDAAV